MPSSEMGTGRGQRSLLRRHKLSRLSALSSGSATPSEGRLRCVGFVQTTSLIIDVAGTRSFEAFRGFMSMATERGWAGRLAIAASQYDRLGSGRDGNTPRHSAPQPRCRTVEFRRIPAGARSKDDPALRETRATVAASVRHRTTRISHRKRG